MIISIPTTQGTISFVLNGTLLKAMGLAILLLVILVGYAVVQICTLIFSVTPAQFFHILAVVFLLGIIALLRRVLMTKGNAK